MGDAAPQIDLLPQRAPDGITFTFAAERSLRRVAVAGTFNSWRGDFSPLQRIDAARWQTTLPVAPGRHLYKYVLDGEDWVRDPANPWVSEDGQGNSCFTLTEAGELHVRSGCSLLARAGGGAALRHRQPRGRVAQAGAPHSAGGAVVPSWA